MGDATAEDLIGAVAASKDSEQRITEAANVYDNSLDWEEIRRLARRAAQKMTNGTLLQNNDELKLHDCTFELVASCIR
ncbi:hypothetical protein L915_10664 [Phytophthora nicotianae]|nr:hypothetical protein L915_10664 [Phytophthora nicotianae]